MKFYSIFRHLLLLLALQLTFPHLSSAQSPGNKDSLASDIFWQRLQAICGKSFEGSVTHAPVGDTVFINKALIMEVRKCSDNEIRIPFHVGENRSRTWVLTKKENRILLKHDHRHEDGSEDHITQYGGWTPNSGQAGSQILIADQETTDLLPPASHNVWMIEIEPGNIFAYSLRRQGTDRYFRVSFDLKKQIEAPPSPWGWPDK
jgi:hypothetical protein